jgi:cyanophycinase-like exopeptidase
VTGHQSKRRTPAIHLIGGGPRIARKGSDPLLEAAFAEAGEPHPAIAYVGAASDDDRGFFRLLDDLFRRSGASEVRLVALASPRSDAAAARELLQRSDIVFVSGGDVEIGMAHLERHGLVPYLRDLYGGGKPFFGASAGSIMLARCWVRWVKPDDEASAEIFSCLGMAPVMCDTHAEADDWEELRALLALADDGVGFGIPTGATLRVGSDGSVSALGGAVHRLERRGGRIERLPDLTP